MALIDTENTPDNSNQVLPEWQQPAEPQPLSTQEFAKLQTRTAEQTWFGSLIHNGLGDWSKSDPNYNPVDHIKDTEYMDYPEYFINTDNEQELNDAKRKVDEHKEYLGLAARAPDTAFWSSMAWSAIDPMLAIPGFGAAKLARTAEGINAARTIAATAAISSGAMGLEEIPLQGNDPNRTWKEAATNMAVGGIVGAAFGGLAARSASKAQVEAEAALKPVMNIEDPVTPEDIVAAKNNLNADNYIPLDQHLNDHNMEGHTTPLMKQYLEENNPEKLLSAAADKKAFEERMAAQTKDSAVEDMLAEILNKRDLPVNPELAPIKSEGELSATLDTQSIGSGYVTYDARIKGLPPNILKMTTVPGLTPPSIEGLADASPIVRDFTTRIGYMHFPLQRVEEKVIAPTNIGEMPKVEQQYSQVTAPVSLESAMQQDYLKTLDFNKQMDTTYQRYLQIDPNSLGSGFRANIKGRFGSGVIKSRAFDEMTMDAMNNGDRHVIPEVQERAQYTRNLLNDQWKRMQDVGLIEKGVKPIPNYFKVVYDMPAIIKDRAAFEESLTRRLMSKSKAEVTYIKNGKELTAPATLDHETKQVDWYPGEGEQLKNIKVTDPMDEETARSTASDLTDNILRMGDKSLQLGDIDRLSFTRGTDSGKPRHIVTSNADYQALKPWMVKDFRSLVHSYVASTSRAVNYKKMLNELGVENLQELRQRIRDGYKEQIYKVRSADTYKGKKLTIQQKKDMEAKLNKQAQKSLALFNDIAQISLGQFKKRTNADSLIRTVNQYTVSSLYGGIILSSLADPMAATIKNSIPNVLWNGWLNTLKTFANGTSKLKSTDYRNALTAIQNEMDDLVKNLVNPDFTPQSAGLGERTMRVASNVQMKASLMTTWNNFWQKVSHNLAEANILNYISKDSEKGISYLKEIGIDEKMGKRILKMQKKYGEEVRGTHISNSHMWSDAEAAARFNNAIRTEVHKSPLITELLDIPRFFQKSELRRAMFLGKGFNSAATSKILYNVAARRNANAFIGLSMLVSAGMAIKAIQDKAKGKSSDYSLKDWLVYGIDKSGVLGLIGDPFIQGYYANKQIQQYGNKAWITSPLDYLLGPNANLLTAPYRAIMEKGAGQDMDPLTRYKVKSLLPYSHLWWLNLGK